MSINRLLLVLLAALLLPGLALAQSSRATFAVTKDFSDGNTRDSATVTISCNFGLPLTQSKSIKDTGGVGVTFVLESYGANTNCDITEANVAGYTNSNAEAGGTGSGVSSDTATKCTFTNIGNGDAKTCKLTNDPTPVEVTVYKDWVIEGAGGNSVEDYYEITLRCNSRILGVEPIEGIGGYWTKTVHNTNGLESDFYDFDVVPLWSNNGFCSASEETFDSAIETTGDCGQYAIHPVLGGGGDDSCTFTNSVYFEGIPTLSQYGMAIMALLMLGVGFVGFRRFV